MTHGALDNATATAVVVLHGGQRLSWKVVRGHTPSLGQALSTRYFCGLDPDECEVVVRTGFWDFESAETWCASFEGHPNEA